MAGPKKDNFNKQKDFNSLTPWSKLVAWLTEKGMQATKRER